MSTQAPEFSQKDIPLNAHIGIAAARFNWPIVEKLLEGCLGRLKELGIDGSRVDVVKVPGAFELPLAALTLLKTKRYAAVVCLGAVIRGETPHFDYVAGECARGIMNVSVQTGLPVIFGVLTTNDEAQARDRIGGKHGHAGVRAAEAALEMIAMQESMHRK
jgi:6,7-dimethyl-8-ribityllumazine synthase